MRRSIPCGREYQTALGQASLSGCKYLFFSSAMSKRTAFTPAPIVARLAFLRGRVGAWPAASRRLVWIDHRRSLPRLSTKFEHRLTKHGNEIALLKLLEDGRNGNNCTELCPLHPAF